MNGGSVICRSQTGRIIAGVTQELRTLLCVVAPHALLRFRAAMENALQDIKILQGVLLSNIFGVI